MFKKLVIVLMLICNVCYAYDLEYSGCTPEELETLVSGTAMEGTGNTFYQIEQDYGVSAVFAIAVAQLESGSGTSDMAQYDNNLFGMMGCRYWSFGESIRDFGDLMKYYYFNRGYTTLESINPIYCPGNYNWKYLIEDLMRENYRYIGR